MKPDTSTEAREKAKNRIIASGKTYDQIAKEIGFPKWLINRVLNGISKAKYGNAHACAVALGVKEPALKTTHDSARSEAA